MRCLVPVLLCCVALSMLGCDARAAERYSLGSENLPNAKFLEDGTWETSSWFDEPWLRYPGSAEIEVAHPLGRVPAIVVVYISFSENGEDSALASGDLARLEGISQSSVTFENGTEQDYYARLVLR